MKLSLAIITSHKDLPRANALITYLKDHVDEVCLTVADKEKGELPKGATFFEWTDDFAEARNFNFSHCTGDWILWLDADDSITNPKALRDVCIRADKLGANLINLLYHYNFDENGNCIDQHWKGQIVKRGTAEWKGAIHENLMPIGTPKIVAVHEIARIHKTDGERGKDSSDRNKRILEKELEKHPDEPRNMFYLGRAYIMLGETEKAVNILNRYLELSGWDDERYEARLLIGQCYLSNGQSELALEWYNSAILEKEEYPDAYIYKGMCYMKQEDFKNALTNFETAVIKKIPESNTFFNPMLYKRDLPCSLAVCYMNVGQIEDAKKYIGIAIRNDKDNKTAKDIKQAVDYISEKNEILKTYAWLATQIKDKNRMQYLLNSVPQNISDEPFILKLRSDYFGNKDWDSNEIAVFCGGTVEDWTPENVNKGGIGGSETAVVELSRRLSTKGWKVTVYNQCGLEPGGKEFDGVLYKNYWEFNPRDKFNVLWAWRTPGLFDLGIEANLKLLDLHDTMAPGDIDKDLADKLDVIMVKTEYHRSLYPDVPDDKFEIVGNGIDLSRFNIGAKEPKRFMYSSTPNRGLDIILKNIWHRIIAKHPDATLHVYYGWKTFYEMEKHNPAKMKWMKETQELMKQKGVINHGRVGQKRLAEDMAVSSYWLYPTDFPEIHCMTACEMQAAGVIPITSGFAALAETAKRCVIIKGEVRSEAYGAEFAEKVLDVMEQDNSKLINNIITGAKEFDWDLVADNWDKICKKRLKK
jgi:tetratricopeptide (TPR) repeat protein